MDDMFNTPTAQVEQIKGQIVTGTLDTLNATSKKSSSKASHRSDMSNTYEFSKSVLSSVYEGKGTIIDSTK